jgi:putative thioredoxin
MTHDVGNFEQEVLERSRATPVLVDFWAAWCGPCRVLGPVLERLAGEAQGRWVLAKVDTERFPEVSERYGIMSIPNVKLFVNGEVVDEFVGALPEPEVRTWLERAVPSPHAATLIEAARLIERGAFDKAAALVRSVLEAEPGNGIARVVLAEALLHLEPEAVAPALREIADHPELEARADALETLARLATLPQRADGLPESSARPRLLAAAAAVRAGDWAAALEALIEALTLDRGYADGLAKESGRALFILLGIGHPVSERFHRAFSNALYV